MFVPMVRTLIGVSLLVLLLPTAAEAQVGRRVGLGIGVGPGFGGGVGVQINAPLVRFNRGARRANSAQAPTNDQEPRGRVFIGRRRRLMAQQQEAEAARQAASRQRRTAQPAAPQPEVADVDSLPYPTVDQLAGMNDTELVETLRQMMARLHYRLSRLNTGEGWQKYLVLSREVLGSPGAPPEAADFAAIQEILPRYQSVQGDSRFGKISSFPGFVAAFAALEEANLRAGNYDLTGRTAVNELNQLEFPGPAQDSDEEPLEILPTPQPTAVVPDAASGERSILKRK